MTSITIASLKDHLSEILERVEAGEEITVCRRSQPVAVLRPATDLISPRSWKDVKGWVNEKDFVQLDKTLSNLRQSKPRNPFAS